MKKFFQLKLKILAKIILSKYKPEIIGITGSVGKTEAKEAVYAVLKSKYAVRRSIKNYNNEIGLPLTVIGVESPGRNIFGWLAVFFRAWRVIIFGDKNYPQILILEMGVDRPGDMDYLNSIIRCDIGILTFVGTVHAEFFGSRRELGREKMKLIKNVKKSGRSIINYDNEGSRRARAVSRAGVLTYGLEREADVRAEKINYNAEWQERSGRFGFYGLGGMDFKLYYQGDEASVRLPRVIGRPAVYAALAGAAAGIAKKMKLKEIAGALSQFDPPPGRMNLLAGIKGTLIIDDTYNSSPESSMAALEMIRVIPRPPSFESGDGIRKFAVLGDMLELGVYSEAGHRQVGKYAVKCGTDKLVVVGERARDIARGAEEAGMNRDNIFYFGNSATAGKFLQERIRRGDLILVKGSQGVRMEKIVEEIMAEPLAADKLLVRQGAEWKN